MSAPYGPSFLDSAYNATGIGAAGTNGHGSIVAVVVAGDDPNLASDLAIYRSEFSLDSCPSGVVSASQQNCVLQVVNELGNVAPLPTPSVAWGFETSIDTQMISALCPNCQILVVEANSANIGDLGHSVNTAVSLGASVVNNSYGTPEFAGEVAVSNEYYNHPGVAIVAASGDSGYGVQFPAASPYVTAVGGTSLHPATIAGARDFVESAWSGTGSGCSVYEPKPVWQSDTGCPYRTVTDVAAEADPSTGVSVYDTFGEPGTEIAGGTSVASAIVSGLYGLAGVGANPSSYPVSQLYSNSSGLTSISTGANATCGTYLCDASISQNGYNGPTGRGVVTGASALVAPLLSRTALAGWK